MDVMSVPASRGVTGGCTVAGRILGRMFYSTDRVSRFSNSSIRNFKENISAP